MVGFTVANSVYHAAHSWGR